MTKRTKISLGAVAVACCALQASPVTAQQDPTEVGGAKKPYVLMIIDSSASMEYTTKGDNTFPILDRNNNGTADTGTGTLMSPGAREWYPGIEMDADANQGFGSCFMYHPSTGCDAYQRPSWRPQPPAAAGLPTPPSSWDPGSPSIATALPTMRGLSLYTTYCPIFPTLCGSAGWRLTNRAQPRHVTIKEIMTGNMILLPNDTLGGDPTDFNANTFGPGCWFVPRQRDASTQSLEDQNYCDGVAAFEDIPDFDQPLPHFQEVYDVQQPTGVMDRLSTTALFAVAAFDSFRDDQNWSGYNSELNDAMAGSAPSWSSLRTDADEDTADCDGDPITPEGCYNLGIWRVVGPSDLSIPSTLLPELAAYTQVAVNDTGFLRQEGSPDWKKDDYTLYVDEKESSKHNSHLGVRFSKNFEKYATDVDLGRQPIARATPIAAAIHDVYQFMANGQGTGGDAEHPIDDDIFRNCRPKHVVMLTDGKPEPERGPTGESDTLNEAFGYDISRYKYETAEDEINAFVTDIDDVVWPDNGADAEELNKYNPRVHVVGLNIGIDDPSDPTPDTDALRKMAQMAIAGNSCASALVPQLVPNTHSYDAGGGSFVTGTCFPGTGCLVPQGSYIDSAYSGYTWMHPASEEVYACEDFPALILDNNDPQKLSDAIFAFMSALVDTSGLTSRTRAVIANRLDDATLQAGGQYRIYSGVRIGGGSPWWKGVLNRTTLDCAGTPDAELSLDQEIGYQVDLSGAQPQDNRRVWTAMPHEDRWCYECATPGPRDISAADTLFAQEYDLQGNYDAFGSTYLAGATATAIVNTRLPFRFEAIKNSMPVDPFVEFNTTDQDEFEEVVNVFRGRTGLRVSDDRGGDLADFNGQPHDRVLGGILNSNPVVVGPPQLDLPIESYRQFRSRFAERPTMLYVSSMDGLLHAVHTGRLNSSVMVRSMMSDGAAVSENEGNAEAQREAWAYVPWMIHKELSSYTGSQAYLVDGTPVVQDVRLCNQDGDENTNKQACKSVCTTAGCTVTGAEQWRTVLVQGRGEAGTGYYAMDITRPGGRTVSYGSGDVEAPDPILLWEFDDDWEEAQLKYLIDKGEKLRILSNEASSQPDSSFLTGCADADEFWHSSLMGRSISQPALGSVIVNGRQRPVAIFGGGGSLPDSTACGAAGAGHAIYVIDLQTGSILRRFTHYDSGSGDISFMNGSTPHRFSGSPALFDASTGSIATRSFIGDEEGRMFRIDMLNPDPKEWSVSLFYDPRDESVSGWNSADWGPASFKPTVTLNASRDVVVVYGTGEVSDLVNTDKKEAVFAVVENRANFDEGILTWVQEFEDYEKLTGSPIIFNGDVYFPTYKLPSEDQCDPGTARIWGLRLTDPDPTPGAFDSLGIFAGNPAIVDADPSELNIDTTNYKWFGPVEPTLIRGLTVTLGQICSTTDIGDPADQAFNPGAQPQPQLIAQTSAPVANEFSNTGDPSPLANTLSRMETPINRPESQTLPLSWGLLY